MPFLRFEQRAVIFQGQHMVQLTQIYINSDFVERLRIRAMIRRLNRVARPPFIHAAEFVEPARDPFTAGVQPRTPPRDEPGAKRARCN